MHELTLLSTLRRTYLVFPTCFSFSIPDGAKCTVLEMLSSKQHPLQVQTGDDEKRPTLAVRTPYIVLHGRSHDVGLRYAPFDVLQTQAMASFQTEKEFTEVEPSKRT